MKRPVLALLSLCYLSGCQTSPPPPPVVVVVTATPPAAAAMVLAPTLAPAAAPLPPGSFHIKGSDGELKYADHFKQVMDLLTKARGEISNPSDSPKADVGLALADTQTAFNLQTSNFNVPQRFAVADGYLSQGTEKQLDGLRRLDMGIGETGRDAYVASATILNSAMDEFQKQIDAMKTP